jgi:hypothetical protein
VTDDAYKRALQDALRELAELGRKSAQIDERRAQLAQTIGNLSRLCGVKPDVPWGITDACRMVLRAARRPLTPSEIRDQLEAMGLDVSRYSNQLAPIHTVLKRLHGAGEAEVRAATDDKPGYVWKGTSYVPFDIAALFGMQASKSKKRGGRGDR